MSQSAAKIKPAAGSANLMSPHIAAQDTLGANKRIRADMISKFLHRVLIAFDFSDRGSRFDSYAFLQRTTFGSKVCNRR